MHVLLKGFHRICHYDLLAKGGVTRAEKLERDQWQSECGQAASERLVSWRLAVAAGVDRLGSRCSTFGWVSAKPPSWERHDLESWIDAIGRAFAGGISTPIPYKEN